MSTEDFATKVVKNSIAEVKDEMPKELSRFIRFTAAVHVYSWVIRSEKTPELIAWLQGNGFKNIQTDVSINDLPNLEENITANRFITVTATADAAASVCIGYQTCGPACSSYDNVTACNSASSNIKENAMPYYAGCSQCIGKQYYCNWTNNYWTNNYCEPSYIRAYYCQPSNPVTIRNYRCYYTNSPYYTNHDSTK